MIMTKNSLFIPNYFASKTLKILIALIWLNCYHVNSQCNNYQVYESIGTAIPTSGGTWASTSVTYSTGSARTGSNNLVFDGAGDVIRTPLIANPGIISFWYSRSSDTTAHSFNIMTSPDGTTWTSRGTTTTPTVAYQQFSINLAALGLTNVYIQIIDTRASGASLRYIDDISWTSTVTANNVVIPALNSCNQTITCGTSYIFSDAGTVNDTYNISSDYTITFTPSIGTNKVQLAFSAFNTESGYDGMVIYNGPTTTSPIISSGFVAGGNPTNCPAGSYYGLISPGTITSSDASGAITIRFRSDTSINNSGWIANVTCATLCTAPTTQPSALLLTQPSNGTVNGAFSAASPSPTNYLVVYNTTGLAPAPVNGSTYTVGGTVGSGNIVADNDTNTSFTVSGLSSLTQYYFFVFSFNSACGGGPVYLTASPLSGNTTTPFFYCTANNPTNTIYYISGITTTGGATNFANTGTGFSAGGYINYSGTYSVSQIPGLGFNITATHPSSTYGYSVWVDWNSDGDFLDIGESVISTGYLSSPAAVGTVIVPVSTAAGNYRMRIRNAYLNNPPAACGSHDYGEAEDYKITVIASVPCSTPTAQPTSLVLSSIASTSINGSFTAAGPAPSGYLIVRSSSATPPALVNGITYAVGFTGLTPGTTYVVQGSAAISPSISFSDTGLTSNTRYYYYIFSYNSACTGAPFYLTTAPLNNGAGITTCAASPTAAINSSLTGTSFTVSWTASAAGGGLGAINYTLEVYTNAGYTIALPGSPFSLGAALTYNVTGLTAGTTYYYRIKANNGTCDSGYLTGTASTTIVNNQCANAIFLPCGTINLAGTSAGATSFTHGTGCTMSSYGVWYTFTGDGNQNLISVTTSSYDITMSISSGACGMLTNITCQDVALSSGTESYSFTTVNGTIYYVYLAHYSSSSATTGSFTISRSCTAAPPPLTNDECSGAISLTATSTCSYTTYTNLGATNSTGMTAPGCASFSGGDVWFSVVVPATGQIDVDLQTGSMTDSGLALYSGSCGALSLLDCDDDSSNNGLMSYLSRTGLTPGNTIYIRVWEFGNDNNGTFGICVSTPICPSPADLNANILSTTSVTVNWTPSSPPASGGYQYYINTTNVAPTNATTPTGSTAAGVIGVTLTGLTAGLKYYFWVRSFCGGSDISTWFGPTNYTPCAVGTGSGTTTLACPSVTSGGLGLNGANPPTMTCMALACVDLEASYLQISQPTNYSVAAIPYTPPYQFTCLQNPVSVNIDDIWSPTINLPFNFCFYGNNYNRCLIGSNGVITFDTTTYAPGGYNAWSFTNSLPSANLFKNTIFGVYQDIDPSKGGQVGYELITLNTGCRALVASWNDIPMYSSSCNSILYTGMIVLYENTNVIEVYVKEKNVCSTWNAGNAIVGLQNAAANAAVVAPGRNGLDADWTATNEAWRFTPTGSSLTSIKWFEGNGTAGTQLGTANTLNVCPSVTTTYTAEVTYALCSGTNLQYTDNVVVTVDGNKIWDGSTDNSWNVADNWTPSGIPTSANCVVIPVTSNNPVLLNSPNGVGYNLAVYNGAQLTVNSNNSVTITDKVTVQPTGIFTINNSASLIQINNILNSGNIIYKRTSLNIRTLDYVYWSSPVANFNISNIVSPYAFGPIYHWNTTVANSNGGQGTWLNFSGTMVAGKGYIARSPGTSPFNNSTYNPLNGSFTGVPNNGNITLPIERGNDQNVANHYGTNGVQITNLSDNWNLLGNPYPSALRGSQFLFDNNTKIEGNIRLWTHGNLPIYTTNPFYSSFVYNYTSGDYLTYNFTGTNCCPTASLDLFIGAGQGFFVQMIDGPQVLAAANVTVAFNNNQRSAAFDNSIFYKTSNASTFASTMNVNTLERNRIWLDLVNSNGQSDRTLFGYIENATMGIDSFFDCITQNSGENLIYTEIGDTKFNIQGRALPFDINDEVAIGINAPTSGNYTIGIAAVDGLFNSQNIYLKDILLDVTHNIKANPYAFTTISGAINNRFKIVYADALGTTTFDENNIKVIVNNEVSVNSSNLNMESIVIYNLLGQKLDTYQNVNANYIILANLHKTNTTLLLKIKLQTGETVTKKIIF